MFDAGVMNEGVGRAAEVESLGSSPDGLGLYEVPGGGGYPTQSAAMYAPMQSVPQQQAPMAQAIPPGAMIPQGMAGEQIEWLEPDEVSSGATAQSAGFTLLFVALGTGVGYALKGGMGAAAGLLICGGLANAYRAQKWFDSSDPSEKHEAIVSSVFALGELGAGAFVTYKAIQYDEKRGKKSKRGRRDDDE